MQFTVSKSALCQALAMVSGVVEKKTSIPILSNVKLAADGDSLSITGTDLETALSVTIKAEVSSPGVFTLPAKKLSDYSRLLVDGDVRIKVGENQWATITSGRSRTRLAGMNAESFPELPPAPDAMVQMDARLLARQLGRVSFAISTEASRFTLNGALMEFAGGSIRCVATDGHRLAWTESAGAAGGGASFLMPLAAIRAYAKIADSSEGGSRVDIATDENHLFFSIGPYRLVARKVTGNFPDYKRVLPTNETYVTVDREQLKSALERVRQFSDERSQAVKFTFADGQILITAASVEMGESEETVPCEGALALEIGLKAQYVLEALAVSSHMKTAVYLKDGKSAAEIRPMSGAGTEQDPFAPATDYRYVVMPMRL